MNHGNLLGNTLHNYRRTVNNTPRQVRRSGPIPQPQFITELGHVGTRHQGLRM